MLNQLWNWWKNKRETSLESNYLQHIQMSRLEQEQNRKKVEQRRKTELAKKSHQQRQHLGHQLQISFMQLASAPDAQRLLSWTNRSANLPINFRRRQFSRFQRLLMEQIPRWLAADVNREQLEGDLRAIVQNMGVAKFEADYMVNAMNPNRAAPNPSSAEVFAGQLTDIQAEHQRRTQTIEAMTNLDSAVKEELMEAEPEAGASRRRLRPRGGTAPPQPRDCAWMRRRLGH